MKKFLSLMVLSLLVFASCSKNNSAMPTSPIIKSSLVDTDTPTDTPTGSPTLTNTATSTPTETGTNTPVNTNTITWTATDSPTNTATDSPTITWTSTPTETFTDSPTFTNTETPTETATFTSTPSNTPTVCAFTDGPTIVPYIDPLHPSARAVSITWTCSCVGWGEALVSYTTVFGTNSAKFQDGYGNTHTVTQNFHDSTGRWYLLYPNRTYYFVLQNLNRNGVETLRSPVYSFTTLP